MKRRVFYSFHYKEDYWRTARVRNIGVVEGNRPATDNDWEKVEGGGERAIKNWIHNQLKGCSCTIVLVGEKTAGSRWVKYEIKQSWIMGKGVAGVYIHGLKDKFGYTANMGRDPFDSVIVPICGSEVRLSKILKCCKPSGSDSSERYDWIKKYLAHIVEEAIRIRKQY